MNARLLPCVAVLCFVGCGMLPRCAIAQEAYFSPQQIQELVASGVAKAEGARGGGGFDGHQGGTNTFVWAQSNDRRISFYTQNGEALGEYRDETRCNWRSVRIDEMYLTHSAKRRQGPSGESSEFTGRLLFVRKLSTYHWRDAICVGSTTEWTLLERERDGTFPEQLQHKTEETSMALVTVVVPEHAMTEGCTYSLTIYWQNPSEFEKEFYGLTQGKGIGVDLGQTTVKGRWVKVLEWPTSRPAFLLELSETTPDPSGPAGGTTKVVAAIKRTHGFTQGESITFDPAITDTDAWGDQEPKAPQPAIVTGAVPGTDQHPAEAALRAFIDHIANKRFESAYALISEEARTNGDSTVREAPVTWESFCFELTVRPGDLVALIQFIEAGLKELDKREEAPSSTPVLGHSVGRPSLLDSAPLPVELLRILKCNDLTVGEIRILPDGRVQFPVVTRYGGRVVDRDQVVLVEEPDGWKITNPIHFIR